MVYIEFGLLVSILSETPVGEFPPVRLLSLGGWGQWFDGNLSPVKTATMQKPYLLTTQRRTKCPEVFITCCLLASELHLEVG